MANIVLIPNLLGGLNYSIAPSVASNNLTVAIKDAAGNNPSASSPCTFRVGGSERLLSTSLSVTKNAGTDWAGLGGTSFAALEQDLFVYIVWNSNTSALDVLWSRIPTATVYSDFSATTTNDKYGAINATAPAAGDDVVNIGRFAATLSAGAGYTWTVPTYTTSNLIQRPCFETRNSTYNWAATNLTTTTGTTTCKYQIVGGLVHGFIDFKFGASSALAGALAFTLPLSVTSYAVDASSRRVIGRAGFLDSGTAVYVGDVGVNGSSTLGDVRVGNSSGTYDSLTVLSSTVPFTWATGDSIGLEFMYAY
jgi:hypothetical protein